MSFPAFRRRRRLPIVVVLMTLIVGSGSPTQAATSAGSAVPSTAAASMATTILSNLNRDRVARGLVALRVDPRLATLASTRAGRMAAAGVLSHVVAGDLGADVSRSGVSWFSAGEALASSGEVPGGAAATSLYNQWRGSPDHWALMMSQTFNYIGVGVAVRSGSGASYSSIVFFEAVDSTLPVASITRASVTGRTIAFNWAGRDTHLQTHTAGLRNFDVQYRVDTGPWKTILAATSRTSLTLTGRPAGHRYSIRVRDRDRRNNLSPWTPARTVLVR